MAKCHENNSSLFSKTNVDIWKMKADTGHPRAGAEIMGKVLFLWR